MIKTRMKFLWKALLVGVAAIVICQCLGCQKTVYVVGFDKSRFRTVEIGDSVESACEKAGLPLSAWVQYTGVQDKRLPREVKPVTIEELKKAVREPDSFTIVHYSKGEKPYLNYVDYTLHFSGGKVQRKSEALMDR